RGLRGVLGASRPQQVLVVLENNAELRGTGGIVTVFAKATARDGRLKVDAFQDVDSVADLAPQVRRVPAPPDFHRLYGGFLADTTLWKNTNMDPDIPTSSQVLANVATVSLGRRPDAVLWLDVPTIAAVLRATGPVRLPDGTELTAENAVTRLLSTAYRDAPNTADGQGQRRAALRSAADAVLGDLLGSGTSAPSPVALARELFTAARGRHLALWSDHAAVQRDLASSGLDGAVRAGSGDVSSFAVHNLGGGDTDGNKLDFYGRRHVTVQVAVTRDHAEVSQEVSLRNTAPARGLPIYVSGRVTPGVANSFITMALPSGALDVVFSRSGRRIVTSPLPSGDHEVVTDIASLPPGTMTTWTLRYRLPLTTGHYQLALVPQPLAVDAGLSLTMRSLGGDELLAPGLDRGPDGELARSGGFTEAVEVDATLERPGLLRRTARALSHFWSEPVSLG
ncbi:MAG: DUF4012 domain-containing protein, partial [Frankiales bacterium]|nr:DUF4012 domain-containing protein [Frankiales bacterium]